MITAKIFTKTTIYILVVLMLFSAVQAAPGDVDQSFNAAAYIGGGWMNAAAIQTDGKIIVAGQFNVLNETARHNIMRLNADGTPDTSFNAPDFKDLNGNLNRGEIFALALQADGKILVGGKFEVSGTTYRNIIRLNADGLLDTTFFNNGAQFESSEDVTEIEIHSSGAIYIGGNLQMSNETGSTSQVARLHADGTFDAAFRFVNGGGGLRDIAVQPDGKVLVSDLNMARVNANGSLDGTFQVVASNGWINKILVKPDGKIVIGGNFSTVNGFIQNAVSQVNSDGSFDTNFNTNNLGADGEVYDLALDGGGKILIAGNFNNYNNVSRVRLARLNSDGSLDNSSTFPPPPFAVANIYSLPDGRVFIRSATTINRINTDGSWDFTLNQPRFGMLLTTGNVRDVIQQTDGKLIIGGTFELVNGISKSRLARLNADGSVDASFNSPVFANNIEVLELGIQSNGKILVGLNTGLIRLNSDGTRDFSFVPMSPLNSIGVFDIKVFADDKILANGYWKMLPDGADDPAFNPPTVNGGIYSAAIMPNGQIVIVGDFTQVGATTARRIARLNADGSLDTTFNTQIGANLGVYDVAVQADGKIVVVGRFTFMNNDPTKRYVARLNADGSLNASFNPLVGVYSTANGFEGVFVVTLQPDGKILIGGRITTVNGAPRNHYARLNPNGSLDTSFNAVPGANGYVSEIKLQSDGKILLAGDFTKVNGLSRVGVARLLNSPAVARTLFDYDGDGRADVSVFRPSTNRWYVFKSTDANVSETTFGLSGDTLAPADYDGDGKIDLAIYRASSGDWWYLSSLNGAQVSVHWGAAGDIPRPSDFDGDGKADFIVFRPSNSVWYRFGSTGAVSITAFGLSGDKPVTGDFDGDGKSDLAIFRPTDGNWWYQSSINNAQLAVQWGISTDIPAPADYDGDGKTDFAVYRPSTGVWYIINSGNGSFTIFQFGIAEDKPVPADYDGDGKADIAVFRPSTGTWYQQKTTAGFTAQQFGVSTDIPTENAFVP